MKTVLFIIIFGLAFYLSSYCQVSDEYKAYIRIADSLYHKQEYLKAAESFSYGFRSQGWKGTMQDRYNAACCWALANVPDSAFYNLNRIASMLDYSDLNKMETDKDFQSLHSDNRWRIILEMVRKNKEKSEENLNKPLVAKLDSIYNDDQMYRLQMDSIIKKYGRSSKEVNMWGDAILAKDSINLIKVTTILNKYGWPSNVEIGERGSMTLFLVIQHADLNTQEQYLPLIEKAYEKGNLAGGNMALIKDRILLRKGQNQIYGTQVAFDNQSKSYYLLPLSDIEHVDERRKSLGLTPLFEYLRPWQIIWDPAKYKVQLPEIEKRYKEQYNNSNQR